MQFLYPTSRQFPVDEVCEKIVRELEKRNWQVPGITVFFRPSGSGEEKFGRIVKIEGDDFQLKFYRQQYNHQYPYSDHAAVQDLGIPGKALSIYDNESGPTLEIYVGENWANDREEFWNTPHVNCKLSGESRKYLQYSGDPTKPGDQFKGWPKGRLAYLTHWPDEREYAPNSDEPQYFVTAVVLEEFRQHLEKFVLPKILACPEVTQRTNPFATKKLPFPRGIGPLFCFGEMRDFHRITDGKRLFRYEVWPSNLFGMDSDPEREFRFEDRAGREAVIPDTFDYHLKCGFGKVSRNTPISSLKIPGHQWNYGDYDQSWFIIKVTPKRANGVFIADQGVYDKKELELSKTLLPNQHLSKEQADELYDLREKTIVPIATYKGGYENPVVLVNRELALNEVSIISGPHKMKRQ